MMDYLNIADLAPELASLEVALLLSLVAREQCLIETTEDAIHGVAKELALVCCLMLDAMLMLMYRYPRIRLTCLMQCWTVPRRLRGRRSVVRF